MSFYPENQIKLFELLEKESAPNSLIYAFVDHPCVILFFSYVILFIIANVAITMGYFEMDYQSHRDFLVWEAPAVREWLMYDLAQDYLNKNQDEKR